MDDGYLALCHVIDLPDQADDLGHLLPNLWVMPASVSLRVENTSIAVSLSGLPIQIAELLQLHIVFFFEGFYLCVCRDKVVRRGEVGIFDACDLGADHFQFRLGSLQLRSNLLVLRS